MKEVRQAIQRQIEISPFLDHRFGLMANPGRILLILIFAGELRSSAWKELSGLSNSSFHSARRHLIEKNLIVESNVRAGDSRERSYKISEELTQKLHAIIPGYLEAIKKW